MESSFTVLEKILAMLVHGFNRGGPGKPMLVSLSFLASEAVAELGLPQHEADATLSTLRGRLSVNAPGRHDVFTHFEACTLIRSILDTDDEPNLGEHASTVLRQLKAALHSSAFTFELGMPGYDSFCVTDGKGRTYTITVTQDDSPESE